MKLFFLFLRHTSSMWHSSHTFLEQTQPLVGTHSLGSKFKPDTWWLIRTAHYSNRWLSICNVNLIKCQRSSGGTNQWWMRSGPLIKRATTLRFQIECRFKTKQLRTIPFREHSANQSWLFGIRGQDPWANTRPDTDPNTCQISQDFAQAFAIQFW